MSKRYEKSEKLLERAQKTIPLGSQTFSKSKTQYPFGVSPFFIEKGRGSHVWDVDGNEYIDLICSLSSIVLGYCDADVDEAVRTQLQSGTIFSLSHPIECRVAEKLVEMIPCAEQVRFGKNGSDVTAGAVRLARAHTGRDHILVCGYHGWQDWYIGSTARNLGVPSAVRALTHPFPYNDLEAVETLFKKFPDQIAGVILEPMNAKEPKPGFLEGLRDLTHKHGALLIFDEMLSGFRCANGGAQECFGVTPDLATFGKGMANGYPVSALVGSAKIMRLMEEIFFSFTFGGETLSLAAAEATMAKIQRENVVKGLAAKGTKFMTRAKELLTKHGLQSAISLVGHPSSSALAFQDAGGYTQWELRTLYMQEMLGRGILSLGSHTMNHAHSDQDLETWAKACDEVFGELAGAIEKHDLSTRLHCKVLEPLFKVR